MRAFLTLCLIAVAASEQLGYNYSPSSALVGGSTIGSGIASGIGSGFVSGIGSGIGRGIGSSTASGLGSGIGGGTGGGILGGFSSGPSYSSGSGFGGSLSSSSLSSGGSYGNGGSYTSNSGFASGGLSVAGEIGSGSFSSGGGFSSGGLSSNSLSSNSYVAPAQVVTELNKEYFFHSAPEEAQDASNNQNTQSILKKNLRVVFIKAPENNGVANAALQVVKQATEDQTAIYVLTKQADVSDITQQLQQISEVHSKKPEVHFVKYRTQEDALNAQRTIQSQYDALGGTSKSSNEGVAPILNYASSSPVVSNYQETTAQASGSYSTGGSLSASAPKSSYSAPSGTGSFSGPSAKSSYLPPVAL